MPVFSKTSQQRLASCHQDIQVIFQEVIKTFNCLILCGYRNKEQQAQAYEQGLSQLTFPFSLHNQQPSFAIDVVPYPVDWQDTERFYLFAGFVQGVTESLYDEGLIVHKLQWGGDWKNTLKMSGEQFNDLPHFELIISK